MATRKKKSTGGPQRPRVANPDEDVTGCFARLTAPRELDDDEKRAKWGLPPRADVDALGDYIIELNLDHSGGISGAANSFEELVRQIIAPQLPAQTAAPPDSATAPQAPEIKEQRILRIAKSYYRCRLTDRQWRDLIRLDEVRGRRDRAIYRLWPDFPVSAQTDRSVATIKADAAYRAFNADGEGITWAVIDSGVQGDHPHFGSLATEDDRKQHTCWATAVRDLHRSFADVVEMRGNVPVVRGPLADPDWNPAMDPQQRAQLIEEHRNAALNDEAGHGTHVAGIIAGRAPDDAARVKLYERQYKVSDDGSKLEQAFATRNVQQHRPRGVAPACRIISVRVLDARGKGRASQVIQALEYIRERINDNPKLMRVHGVNLSVGYEFDAEMFACGQSPLCTAVDRLVQEGVVVVTAAGNTGYGSIAASVGTTKVSLSNTINDPGNAALAITVGSTHRDAPHQYGVSYFSSKGPTGDGRLKPDLIAPGERITSCAAGKKLQDAVGDGREPGHAYYVDDSGTSMAAPHVSGAIAAFLSIRREFIGRPQDVKKIFLDSATPLGRERYFEGRGLIDLMRAIQSV